MIKVIIFDIEGVIIFVNKKEAREIIAKKHNFNQEEFEMFVKIHLKKSFKEKWNYKAFFKKLKQDLKINATPQELEKAWIESELSLSKINYPLLKTINKLRKNYKIIAATDTTNLNEKIRKKLDPNLYKNFDFVFLSHKIRKIKREPEFWKNIFKKLKKQKITPEQMLFIDDKKENLETARQFGIQTIHFKDNIKLKADLKKFKIKIS